MPPLSTHLDLLIKTVNDVHRLSHILSDFAHLPPGGADQDEAQALARTLSALNVHREGSVTCQTIYPEETRDEANEEDEAHEEPAKPSHASREPRRVWSLTDPTLNPASALEEVLRSGAQTSAQAFRKVAGALMARLDRLATQGVRPPGSIIPQDFGGKIDYLSDIDHHHLPPTAWGEYDALPEGHVLRAKLKREDAYDHQGKAYVFLGRAISGDMGSRHLPWIPLDVVVKQTLSLSTPQKASRKAKADQDRADDDRRHQQWENSKTVHERNLEAQLAEARKEIAEMKAAGLRTAGVA